MNPENHQPITQDDINQLKQEAENELHQIKEVSDPNLPPVPDKEKLDALKKMIDSMPQEQVSQLLANLAGQNGNIINPQNKSYSTASSNEILRNKLKQKMQQKKYGRMTNFARETEKQKYMEKMQKAQELQKQKQKQATNPTNPTNTTNPTNPITQPEQGVPVNQQTCTDSGCSHDHAHDNDNEHANVKF